MSLPVLSPVPSEPGEEWRPAVGFDGYLISSLGRVASLKGRHPLIMATYTPKPPRDYPRLWLSANGKQRCVRIPQLVADAFLGPRPKGHVIRHLNDVKTDNRPANLVYGTPSENNLDAVRNGRNWLASKTHCKRGHAFDEWNTVRKNGWRKCRTCYNDRMREFHRQKRKIEAARRASDPTTWTSTPLPLAVRALRESSCLSYDEFAKLLGVSTVSVCNWLRGRPMRPAHIERLRVLMRERGVPLPICSADLDPTGTLRLV